MATSYCVDIPHRSLSLSDRDLLQSALADHYRLERELGRGGMATVYLAQDLRHERPVALKVLRPELIAALGAERFLREIRLTARLQHPHILPVLDSGAVPGPEHEILWYTMPYVEGGTLRKRLEREPQLGIEEALTITREVADALDFAHRHGVVHRDVKPENILVSEESSQPQGTVHRGHALVADFGIAKAIAVDAPGVSPAITRLTDTGIALGTPAYMSPEQATGGGMVDARTDVYALGCILYEMLAGEPPYSGSTAQVIVAKRLTDPVPVVSRIRENVPPVIDAALIRALAKVPADRFAGTAEFAAALQSGTTSPAVSPAPRVRRAWPLVATVAILVLLAAGLVLSRRAGTSARSPEGPIPLAVLPFRLLGGSPDSGVVTIGVPDAIITRLASVRQLRVRPTSAILRYREGDPEPRQVGKALTVDYLVTGTVQTAGDRLRVSVQLLRAADATPLWGAHYDLPRKDLLMLQDTIAERVSGTLAVRMSSAEQTRLYRRYTRNAEAYEWYLRGRAELAQVTEGGTTAAIAAFEHALGLDSTYALAQSGLAMASADMHLRFATGPEVKKWGQRAEEEAARALALDSTLAEAHLARAAVARKSEFDWPRTLEESRRALDLNPNLDLAHYFRAAAFYHLGLLDESERELEEALAVDPQNSVEQLRTRGVVAFLDGRYQEAVTYLEEVRRTSSRAYADSYLSQAYFYRGDTLRALGILDSLSGSTSAPAAARARSTLASFVAFRSDRKRAEALIDTVIGAGYLDHHVAFSLGAALVQLGRLAEGRTWLGRAVETGFPCYPWYERDPLLEPLRRDPGSKPFLDGLRGTWEAAKSRYGGAAAVSMAPLSNRVSLLPGAAPPPAVRSSEPRAPSRSVLAEPALLRRE